MCEDSSSPFGAKCPQDIGRPGALPRTDPGSTQRRKEGEREHRKRRHSAALAVQDPCTCKVAVEIPMRSLATREDARGAQNATSGSDCIEASWERHQKVRPE